MIYKENGTSHPLSGKKQPKATGFAQIHSLEQLTQAIRTDLTKVTFAYFYASWHPESLSVLAELQDISEGYLIDCNLVALDTAEEGNFEICHKLQIDCVPKGFLISPDLKIVETLDTSDVNATFEAVEKQIILYRQNFEIEKVRAGTQLNSLLSNHEAVLLVEDSDAANQTQTQSLSTAAVQEQLVSHNLNIPTHAAEGLARWVRVFYGQEKFPQLFIRGALYGDGQTVVNGLQNGDLLHKVPLRYVVGEVKARVSSVLAESRFVLLLADKETVPGHLEEGSVGDVLTALGLQFREYSLKGLSIELEQHLAQRFPGIEYPALFDDGKLINKGKALLELVATRDRSKLGCKEGWSKPPLFVAKKAISGATVAVVGEGPAAQRIITSIKKTGVSSDNVQLVVPNGLVGECLRVLTEGREFPRVFVRSEEVGGEKDIQEMIQDGRFSDLVRPKKGKKKGGCCQGDEPKPSGGCCQDNGSAPKSGGGCCQGSESEEEDDDGCCGDKDEEGGCCGGH